MDIKENKLKKKYIRKKEVKKKIKGNKQKLALNEHENEEKSMK